jgi:hypothetical protein
LRKVTSCLTISLFVMLPKSIVKSALLLLTLCTAGGSRILDILSDHDTSSGGKEFEEDLMDHHRQLSGAEECNLGTTTHYFEVTINLVPDETTNACVRADQVLIGHTINNLLLDYGIGAAGADDDAIFLAGVCPQPSTSSVTTGDRMLGWLGWCYVWRGGGGCRSCYGDNRDHRRRDQFVSSVEGSSEYDNWFSGQYAPSLMTTLQNAITQEMTDSTPTCLGSIAPQIEVVINEISLSDLELGCDDGSVISTLKSLSLSEKPPLLDRNCQQCHSVNFSTYKPFDGESIMPVEKGRYVSDEWQVEYGFTVAAIGGKTDKAHANKARIFDTADQVCVNAENGSLEFGSPNQNCGTSESGLGRGGGGELGESGENCIPVGSKYDDRSLSSVKHQHTIYSLTPLLTSSTTDVLIVQEDDKMCPDSNPGGGTLKFVFDTPVLVSDIGLMDVDEEEQRIRFTYADGFSELFAYNGFGDNAVQRVICNKLNVKELEVIFPGTGAVTELNFCPACGPLSTASQRSVSTCLSTERAEIGRLDEIAFDDFEGTNENDAVDGWENAHWERTEQAGFSQFLGRYEYGMDWPYKVYTVPADAEKVTFEIDFYEIGEVEQVNLYVDAETITLGNFEEDVDEGDRSGSTGQGIAWELSSLTTPRYGDGFNPSCKAQKHRITIRVPATTGLLGDGELRLTLKATLPDPQPGHLGVASFDESVGWDNVRVTVLHKCESITDAP